MECFLVLSDKRKCLEKELAQTSRGIRRGGHGGGIAAPRCIGRNFDRRGIRQANTSVQFQVVFPASRAVSFPRVFIAQAGQLVASTDAIAITGLGSRLNRNQSHWRHPSFGAMLHNINGPDKGPGQLGTILPRLGGSRCRHRFLATIAADLPLSFQTLPRCPSCNPFPFMFLHGCRGGIPTHPR